MCVLCAKPRQEKKPEAIHGVTRWLQRPAFDAGLCGLLVISTASGARVYEVTRHETGYRLSKEDGTGYDLPTDLSSCDCGDGTFRSRPGGCKHMAAMRSAFARLADVTAPAFGGRRKDEGFHCRECGDTGYVADPWTPGERTSCPACMTTYRAA